MGIRRETKTCSLSHFFCTVRITALSQGYGSSSSGLVEAQGRNEGLLSGSGVWRTSSERRSGDRVVWKKTVNAKHASSANEFTVSRFIHRRFLFHLWEETTNQCIGYAEITLDDWLPGPLQRNRRECLLVLHRAGYTQPGNRNESLPDNVKLRISMTSCAVEMRNPLLP